MNPTRKLLLIEHSNFLKANKDKVTFRKKSSAFSQDWIPAVGLCELGQMFGQNYEGFLEKKLIR